MKRTIDECAKLRVWLKQTADRSNGKAADVAVKLSKSMKARRVKPSLSDADYAKVFGASGLTYDGTSAKKKSKSKQK